MALERVQKDTISKKATKGLLPLADARRPRVIGAEPRGVRVDTSGEGTSLRLCVPKSYSRQRARERLMLTGRRGMRSFRNRGP